MPAALRYYTALHVVRSKNLEIKTSNKFYCAVWSSAVCTCVVMASECPHVKQVQLARDKSFLNPRSWTCADCGFTDSVWVCLYTLSVCVYPLHCVRVCV